jgi:two-component system, NarL family, nitrate/nitrite response regulator NarL
LRDNFFRFNETYCFDGLKSFADAECGAHNGALGQVDRSVTSKSRAHHGRRAGGLPSDAPTDERVAATQPPRAIIISDVRLYREGLAFSLARDRRIAVVGIAHSLDEALPIIVGVRPDVVVLDMATAESLAMPKAICAAAPQTKIVAFAVGETEHDIWACAEAGIAGFVARDGSANDLATAIEATMRGELHCSPRVAASLFQRIGTLSRGQPAPAQVAMLTRREREIVRFMDCGLSNKEIALRLQIGATTVKNHVHNILEKLNVHRRAQAVAMLRRGGWPSERAAASASKLQEA